MRYKLRTMFRLARHVARMDEIGDAVSSDDLDDLHQLLGHRPATRGSRAKPSSSASCSPTPMPARHDEHSCSCSTSATCGPQMLLGPAGSAMARHLPSRCSATDEPRSAAGLLSGHVALRARRCSRGRHAGPPGSPQCDRRPDGAGHRRRHHPHRGRRLLDGRHHHPHRQRLLLGCRPQGGAARRRRHHPHAKGWVRRHREACARQAFDRRRGRQGPRRWLRASRSRATSSSPRPTRNSRSPRSATACCRPPAASPGSHGRSRRASRSSSSSPLRRSTPHAPPSSGS